MYRTGDRETVASDYDGRMSESDSLVEGKSK